MAINLRVNFASSSNFCYGRWRNTPTMHVRTLLADSEKRIQAFETKCPRKLLLISDVEHKTNDWVRSKINFLVDLQEPLLATVKRWKLAWFGHATCHSSLSRTILEGILKGG